MSYTWRTSREAIRYLLITPTLPTYHPHQVSYTWRNSPEATLRVKGAYIIKVSMWGRDFCAGVGYSVTLTF